MAELRIWLPEGGYRDWSVPPGRIELGCQPPGENAIQLPNTGNVSRRHAVISGGPGAWTLEDLSTNGSKVDGSEIRRESRPLRDGAQIYFADVRAEFRERETPPPPPPPSDLIKELREGAAFLRNYATLAGTSIERVKEALRVLDRAVVDSDPEVARSALARQLEERGTLARDVHNLDEILRDFTETLAGFEKTLTRASSGARQ